jgi:hypothetical protein
MIIKIVIVIYIILIIITILLGIGYYFYMKRIKNLYYYNGKPNIYLYNLFSDLSGYSLLKNDKYNYTYGEITLESIMNMSKYLDKQNIEKDIFIDLGCGIGKSLIMARIAGFKESYGIELIKERFDQGMMMYNRLDKNEKNNVKIYNGDLFDMEKIRPIDKKRKYVIFVSNLLFSANLNERLWKKLNEILPNNSIVFVSKQLTDEYLDILETPMSWSNMSKCYIYKIKNNII